VAADRPVEAELRRLNAHAQTNPVRTAGIPWQARCRAWWGSRAENAIDAQELRAGSDQREVRVLWPYLDCGVIRIGVRRMAGSVRFAESVIAGRGFIVEEYFDVGCSRRLPWIRRPRAAALLAQLPRVGRGFDAIVVGEYERAYFGEQFPQLAPCLDGTGCRSGFLRQAGRSTSGAWSIRP